MARIKNIQQQAAVETMLAEFGMRTDRASQHGAWAGIAERADILAVYPMVDRLPHYARDAELFVGTLEDIELWVQGLSWARGYYNMLGLVDERLVARKEKEEHQRQLLSSIGSGQAPRLRR